MTNETENMALLQEVARGTEMGKNTLEQMLPLTEDRLLRAELLEEQRGYRSLNQRAHTAIAALGGEAEGAGSLEKLGAKMGILSRTLGGRSTQKLAQMLVAPVRALPPACRPRTAPRTPARAQGSSRTSCWNSSGRTCKAWNAFCEAAPLVSPRGEGFFDGSAFFCGEKTPAPDA